MKYIYDVTLFWSLLIVNIYVIISFCQLRAVKFLIILTFKLPKSSIQYKQYCFYLGRININNVLCVHTLLGLSEQFTSLSKTVTLIKLQRFTVFVQRKMKDQKVVELDGHLLSRITQVGALMIVNRWQQRLGEGNKQVTVSTDQAHLQADKVNK